MRLPDPLHMNVFLWIVAGQLALVFLAAGAMKLLRTKEDLAENGRGWTVDFSIPVVKSIGALEILAALDLICRRCSISCPSLYRSPRLAWCC